MKSLKIKKIKSKEINKTLKKQYGGLANILEKSFILLYGNGNDLAKLGVYLFDRFILSYNVDNTRIFFFVDVNPKKKERIMVNGEKIPISAPTDVLDIIQITDLKKKTENDRLKKHLNILKKQTKILINPDELNLEENKLLKLNVCFLVLEGSGSGSGSTDVSSPINRIVCETIELELLNRFVDNYNKSEGEIIEELREKRFIRDGVEMSIICIERSGFLILLYILINNVSRRRYELIEVFSYIQQSLSNVNIGSLCFYDINTKKMNYKDKKKFEEKILEKVSKKEVSSQEEGRVSSTLLFERKEKENKGNEGKEILQDDDDFNQSKFIFERLMVKETKEIYDSLPNDDVRDEIIRRMMLLEQEMNEHDIDKLFRIAYKDYLEKEKKSKLGVFEEPKKPKVPERKDEELEKELQELAEEPQEPQRKEPQIEGSRKDEKLKKELQELEEKKIKELEEELEELQKQLEEEKREKLQKQLEELGKREKKRKELREKNRKELEELQKLEKELQEEEKNRKELGELGKLEGSQPQGETGDIGENVRGHLLSELLNAARAASDAALASMRALADSSTQLASRAALLASESAIRASRFSHRLIMESSRMGAELSELLVFASLNAAQSAQVSAIRAFNAIKMYSPSNANVSNVIKRLDMNIFNLSMKIKNIKLNKKVEDFNKLIYSSNERMIYT